MSTNRHYGLKLWQRVAEVAFGNRLEGVVVNLSWTDNNRATIRLDDGTETDVVCEWCRPA